MKGLCLGLVLLLSGSTTFAWGARGHALVADLGARLTKDGNAFWVANADNMANLSIVPDAIWKLPPTAAAEQPNHWLHIDFFYKNSKQFENFPASYKAAVAQWGQEAVIREGTGLWRIRQLYKLAVDAFRAKNYVLGLQMAGVMSHYIGDFAQPLHVTVNYDGQLTGNPGIHAFFESTNLNNTDLAALRADVGKQALSLLQNNEFQKDFKNTFHLAIMREVKRSQALKDTVINTDLSQGRTGEGAAVQLDIARTRLADGAATLAVILSKLWMEAGNPKISSTLQVGPPAFVPPNFN